MSVGYLFSSFRSLTQLVSATLVAWAAYSTPLNWLNTQSPRGVWQLSRSVKVFSCFCRSDHICSLGLSKICTFLVVRLWQHKRDMSAHYCQYG